MMSTHELIEDHAAVQKSLIYVQDLLVAALGMIDQIGLPAQIGAQLDQSIQTLRQHRGLGCSPLLLGSPD